MTSCVVLSQVQKGIAVVILNIEIKHIESVKIEYILN